MYMHAVIGGTFDHIHKGHEALIEKALAVGNHLTIGLTTDEYVRTVKYGENVSGVACVGVSRSTIQSYTMREKQLRMFLKKKGVLERTTIVPIDDFYGPTVTHAQAGPAAFLVAPRRSSPTPIDVQFDVIVVSKEGMKNAEKINMARQKNGLPPLAVITIPMVEAYNHTPISTTKIRQGVMDVSGNLVMPESLRTALGQPIGTLMKDGNTESILRGDHDAIVVTVGDKTTKRLMTNGIIPTLAILDMQVERMPYTWEKEDWDKLGAGHTLVHMTSGPGYISKEVLTFLRNWSSNPVPTTLIVDGEEDLLVLPAIVYAPLGSVIYYGQPKQGLVRVEVTKNKKQEIQNLLKQFSL